MLLLPVKATHKLIVTLTRTETKRKKEREREGT